MPSVFARMSASSASGRRLPPSSRAQQRGALPPAEARELQHAAHRRARAAGTPAGPSRPAAPACRGRRPRATAEQLGRGRIGPVQVLEQHQHRAAPGEPGELPEQRLERPRLERRGVELGRAVVRLRGDPEQRGEQRHDPRRLRHGAARAAPPASRAWRARVLAPQAGRALQVLDHREQRGRGVVGRAGEAEHHGASSAALARPAPAPGATCRCRPRPRPAPPGPALARGLPGAEQQAELPPRGRPAAPGGRP